MHHLITIGKTLLIAPLFFLVLQVSLALHHHHTFSYHDDGDYFHSVSTDVDNETGPLDGAPHWPRQVLCYSPLIIPVAQSYDTNHQQATFTTPSHSRAPPPIIQAFVRTGKLCQASL